MKVVMKEKIDEREDQEKMKKIDETRWKTRFFEKKKKKFLFVVAQSVQPHFAAQQSAAAARGLALCPWHHLAWVSEGTPVGPGKDTHGTLGPGQREGRGWPEQQFSTANSADTSQTFFFSLWFFFLIFSSFFGESGRLPRFGSARQAFQGLKLSPHAQVHSQHTGNQRHGLSLDMLCQEMCTNWKGDVAGSGSERAVEFLPSDSCSAHLVSFWSWRAEVRLRKTIRQTTWAAPDEYLMSDFFEHMMTSLYSTDVVVLRNEGDTVNLMGLEITKTSRELRGNKQYRPRRIPVESLRVGKLETDCKSRQTLHIDGARVSNSFARSRLLKLSHSGRTSYLPGTMETRHATRHAETIRTSPQSNNWKQWRSETTDMMTHRHAQHLSFSRNTQLGSKRNHWTCWSSRLRSGRRLCNAPKCYRRSLHWARSHVV